MALNSDTVLDAVESKLLTLGVFEWVNMHEAFNSPGSGVMASVLVDYIGPLAKRSGLAATSAYFVLAMRIETTLRQEPQRGIDRNITRATDAVINALTGDFDVDGTVAEVDVLGEYGQRLEARAGYVKHSGGDEVFRAMHITLPLVLNDVWTQVN